MPIRVWKTSRRCFVAPSRGRVRAIASTQATEMSREIQAQIDTIRQRILSSLLEIRESYNHDQERLSDLEGELKLDLENVRQCAIDYFIKGEYRECERLLTFLAKIQPDDENLENFLELSRRKRLEHEAGEPECCRGRRSLIPRSGDREQRLAAREWPAGLTGCQKQKSVAMRLSLMELRKLHYLRNRRPGTRRSRLRFRADPQERPETIEPQILAEIELKTAAHINEIYRTPPNSAKTTFSCGGNGRGLGTCDDILLAFKIPTGRFCCRKPVSLPIQSGRTGFTQGSFGKICVERLKSYSMPASCKRPDGFVKQSWLRIPGQLCPVSEGLR